MKPCEACGRLPRRQAEPYPHLEFFDHCEHCSSDLCDECFTAGQPCRESPTGQCEHSSDWREEREEGVGT